MKLALISNLYPPIARGGAEKVVQRLTDGLRRAGHDVCIISTRGWRGMVSCWPELMKSEAERVYRFFPFNIYHTLNDHKYPLWIRAFWHAIDLFSFFPRNAVRAVLEQEKPDAVLTHNLRGIGMTIPAAIRALGLPHVHTVHDIQLSVPSGLLFYGKLNALNRTPLRGIYEWITRRAIGSPDVVISPSRFLADFYRERGFFPNSRVEIVPNPAPSYELPPRGARGHGPLRLLFAAQLEHHKGVTMLLDALSRLSIPVELHIAGEGALTPLVLKESQKDSRIVYHGFASSDQIQQLLSFVDATIVASLCYENSPTIIYESLQGGVPVIAVDIGGVAELVKDRENGWLIPPDDSEALAKAITEFDACKNDFWNRSEAIRSSMVPYRMSEYVRRLEELIMVIRTQRS